ncbi:Response regulator receiver protein [Mesorhizobium metallidurans STM 2683]|uniref:Response regulator receiver protein n=1 Tax=Mesorhizobium metallidurans STM 2683 TaxID=1297569 RepID=M5EMV8_9HYPH|nr:response regulator [Mesorhizobium metallidurans]CCV05672.1 Response regulator receiver protein [Mesorhizobium metallidurans STM 2683]
MATALRILIVEDEWLIAEDHAAQLRDAGHRIVGPVASVSAAIDHVEREGPDVALLDIQLNGETSYALADTLRGKAIPFAFVTGHSSNIPERFADIKVLQKPVSQWALTSAVTALVAPEDR